MIDDAETKMRTDAAVLFELKTLVLFFHTLQICELIYIATTFICYFFKQIYCTILISRPSGLVPGLKLCSRSSENLFAPGTWEH
jgi:hypothetical protein